MEIRDGFVGAIGNTPLIRLRRVSEATGCNILGKAEFLNPGGSVKDRAALYIVLDAEQRGLLKPGGVIVEGTAGNTGIGLALVGNARGYRTVIVMPSTQSREKKDMLRLCGAELREVPAAPYKDPNNYVHVSERVAKEITQAGGTASAFLQNTAKPEDCEAVVRHAVTTYGGLHYAVNNAGIGGAQAPAGETDLADWNRVIDINLNGVLYGMRYQIPAMLDSGARESAIVNMASIHGTVAAIGNGAYTAAKHGVVGLTRALALRLAPRRITANALCPGWVATEMAEARWRELGMDAAAAAAATPTGRITTAEEVAAALAWLVSPAAGNVTGQTIVLDGGASL